MAWPTATDLASLQMSKPDFTFEVEVAATPQRARELWGDPNTARRTNPNIERVEVGAKSASGDGERLPFDVTDRLSFCGCNFPISFSAVFFTPSAASSTGSLELYSYAPAQCGVVSINRWSFTASADGASTAVRQDGFIRAPALLRGFSVSAARRGGESGIRQTAELLQNKGGELRATSDAQ